MPKSHIPLEYKVSYHDIYDYYNYIHIYLFLSILISNSSNT